MKYISKLVSVMAIISYLVIFLVLIVAAPVALGYKPVIVLTGSMEPAYEVGSVIYYQAESFDNLAVGDVITFSISDDRQIVITHRIYAIDDASKLIITKGDANPTPDTYPLAPENIRGRVIPYKLPYVGHLVQYIQNYYLIGAVLFILVLKLVFNYYLDPDSIKEKQIGTK
ncbi:MAG: signal peptidase I [Dethiobacteria bacterium]